MLIEMRRAKYTFLPTYSALWTRYSWKIRSRTLDKFLCVFLGALCSGLSLEGNHQTAKEQNRPGHDLSGSYKRRPRDCTPRVCAQRVEVTSC